VKAFTLIELIFVILILALMSTVAVYYIPDNTLNENVKVLRDKILQKRSNAINFFAKDNENNLTCIEFDINKLNEDENSSRVNFHFSKRITIKVSGCDSVSGIDIETNKTACFDTFGRVFVGNVDDKLENLCHNNINISLSYKGKEKNLTIYSISGVVK